MTLLDISPDTYYLKGKLSSDLLQEERKYLQTEYQFIEDKTKITSIKNLLVKTERQIDLSQKPTLELLIKYPLLKNQLNNYYIKYLLAFYTTFNSSD
jgi:hypothetical protein